MHITESGSRREVLEWSHRVKELLDKHGDTAAADGVANAIAQFEENRFLIAVLGKAKRGKSTLLNAMLGRHDDLVAPIDKLPASSAITRLVWAEREAATVFFRDGRQESVGYERIREFVTEERNPENRKGVEIVEAAGPFSGLDRDLILVDTPGAASIHQHHDAILHAFIPQADAVVFLVTARMPLDQDELDLLKNVKAADIRKVFFAVNRVDESNETDIQAAIDHNRKLLADVGVSVERIHRISARNAFRGARASSGIPELLAEVSQFLAANKGRVLAARLVSRVCQCAEPAEQGLVLELASSRKTAGELDEELQKLSESKRGIEEERGLTEREFTLEWDRAVDLFEYSVREARSEAKSAVLNRVARTSLTGLRALIKELPTIVSHSIEDALAAAGQRMEETMSAASRKLQVSYPVIEVKSVGEIAVRTRSGHHVLVGGVSGAAAAATGIGLAMAGSAAAAGIAAANAAAVAAATTTVTAPTALAGLGSLASFLGSLGVPYLGAIGTALAGAGTGTATVAAPVVLTTTPLWVAIAGPVGWTLAGVGLLTVPFAWRVSKVKQKEKLEEACREQVDMVFQRILAERIPALRRMGTSILDDFRLRLDRQLTQIESTISHARDHRPDPQRVSVLQQLNLAFQHALAEAPRLNS